jgi:hypothetical protein
MKWSSIRASRPVFLLGRSWRTATSVYLSTPLLGNEMKLESRAGVAPTWTVLQTAACVSGTQATSGTEHVTRAREGVGQDVRWPALFINFESEP